jgi:trimeric autotransporter adhesin
MLPDGDGGLFLATIAVPPGDPAALAAGSRTYAAAHGEIERNRAALAAASEQVGGPAWQGMGASSYATFTTDLAATYGVTASGLAQGATTLRTYSAALATAQETARQANAAVAVSNATASQLLDAQAAAQQAQASADNAAQAATTAEDQATASPHSSSAQLAATNARSAASDAQSAADSAANQVSVLTGTYGADRARAVSLINEAQSQASHAASAASAGFDAAVTQVAGARPHDPRGSAKGVLGGAKWEKLTDDVNEWITGFEGTWAVPSGIMFVRAATGYFDAAADLEEATGNVQAATDAYKAAYDAFYGVPLTQRTQGWFDLMAKQRAMQAAQSEEAADGVAAAKAEQDLDESIADTGSFVGRFGIGMYGLAIVSDIYTEFRPSSAFGSTGRVLDRVNAGLNMAASGLALGDAADLAVAGSLMAIPGVDVAVGAVLIGTAVYATAELVWEHEGDAIKRDLHDVGHWASDVGSFLGL